MPNTSAPTTAPNMTKEYKAELRALKRQLARNVRGRHSILRATNRKEAQLKRAAEAQIKKMLSSMMREYKALLKADDKIEKRIAILEGRLS